MKNRFGFEGFSFSLLLHALLIVIFLLLQRNEKLKFVDEERKTTLNLNDFKTEKPASAARPTPPPSQKIAPSRAQKSAKEKVSPKAKPTVGEPIKQAEMVKKQPDINASLASKPSVASPASKPIQAEKKPTLLEALNKSLGSSSEAGGKTSKQIKELYKDEFDKMSPLQKEFIKDNLSGIGRITERYLRYPDTAGRMGWAGTSVVEFYLHPNGDISELKLYTPSGFKILDKNSLDTIELAYKDYPRPSEKTKIRIYVNYSIY